MSEWRLFPEGTVPEYTQAEWYAGRENAPHLEEETHRPRLIRSASLVSRAAFAGQLRTVVDLGAGDGGLLSLLGPALRGWGYDLSPAAVRAAKDRGVDVRQGDVLADPIEWGQIAVATEVIEHLVDPHGFVREIAQHCQALVCSSPWPENRHAHYEFHTWAWDFAGYRALVEQGGWSVTHHEAVGPFQVIQAVRA